MSCIFDNSQKQMQGCNNVENYYQMTINYSIIRIYYRDYVKNVYSTLIFCKCFLGLILNLGISGAQGHTVVIWAEKTPSKFLRSVLCRCIITWEWTQTPPLNQWKFQTLKFKLEPQELTQWKEKWGPSALSSALFLVSLRIYITCHLS